MGVVFVRRSLLVLLLVLGVGLVCAGEAFGVVGSAGFGVDGYAAPSDFTVAGGGAYDVEVRDEGSLATDGSPITVVDEVPAGLTVLGTSGPAACSVVGQLVSCEYAGELQPEVCASRGGGCDAGNALHIVITVGVPPGFSGEVTNKVVVSGGGARTVSGSWGNTVEEGRPSFGSSYFDFFIDGLDGARDSEAGGHPYQLTTTIDLKSVISTTKETQPVDTSVQDLRDVVVDLPLGFIGSTLAAPECKLAELSSVAGCPRETQVGDIRTEPNVEEALNSPIWNLVPERGVPAEFGAIDEFGNTHVFFTHVVPTPRGYVLQFINSEIPQAPFSHLVVTFYGDPAARDATGNAQVPFFTNPTACSGGPLEASMWMDSWQNPARTNPNGTPVNLEEPEWVHATATSPPVTGCDELAFTPELFAQPTTAQADTPSGLEFEMKLPQTENVGVHATPALRDSTVTFPEGVTVDPSAGSGLQACSVAQIGWLGETPYNFSQAPPACPEASKIGSLELETPLLRRVLHGELYLARENENPFGSIFAVYVVVNDPTTGVVLKFAGELKADPKTGRLTAYFPETPQLPFSDLKLHFFGGPRAELATPDDCGVFTTVSSLEPWSAPGSGPDGTPFDSFAISEGCVNGFAPAFAAGSADLQAGAYTPFLLSFSRTDAEQELGGLSVTLPEGLLANIGSVPECTPAEIQQAETGTGGCPETSKVGTVTASAGPGPNPLFVTGNAYLTGPYNGGSYGLAVIAPAIAGPFDFGNVVVRQSLRIDPITARVTDVSDPFPAILDPTASNGQQAGVPVKLRRVEVDIDREHFAFNPTSCNKLSLGGTITSLQNTSHPVESSAQVTNCQTLKFTPTVTVTVTGHASKADGAGLTFTIAYPPNPLGSQSWFDEAKFDLPRQLPARLTTLQKACLAGTFEHDRTHCPAGSIIGHATVRTPILAQPLQGPVYFVSYGGQKFPEAVIALQGDDINVELHGETFINKKTGVTSATFHNTPDVPFQSIQVTLPAGPNSEFGTNLPPKAGYDLCNQKLTLPTLLKAQNNTIIHQNTKITPTNCPTHHTTKHHK